MFPKVLIANRGVIACRVIRTLRRMGIRSVAVYSEADLHSLHVAQADETVLIGPAAAADSYMSAARIVEAAQRTGTQAIHPGYGFLSENAEFAEACARAGVTFIGPTPAQMRAFGLKHTARELAAANGVPLLPGSSLLEDVEQALAEAASIGYPLMLKSTAGGGGIGMRLLRAHDDLADAFTSVQRLARANFKDAGVYLEKYVEHARHIEVQIFGDGRGRVVALGERDCSMQRRNQKVVEETPAPRLPPSVRQHLLDAAVQLGAAVAYQSAGTVEFVLDDATAQFYFLEVNTRLQVEHGVTEEVTGIDLVEWMVRQAAGDLSLEGFQPQSLGAAIQVRLYAEDPARKFQPSSGLLTAVQFPTSARVETWVERGSEVSPYYDPMLAKLIVRAPDRAQAVHDLRAALDATTIAGVESNLELLRQVCTDATFVEGRVTTRYLNSFAYQSRAAEVLESGVQTTVQDWPGRLGHWDVGVPPSGPMDYLAHRLANRLLGNDSSAATLECTAAGPTLRFHTATTIALCGADMGTTLDGTAIALWRTLAVCAGSILHLGKVNGPGLRTYIAVAGGFAVPSYLGSRATFPLGRFGGHAGRTLHGGNMLPLAADCERPIRGQTLATSLVPPYGNAWQIGVLYGPHGAPDFFTNADIETFFATAWEVHYNSSRTGVRLIGPKPAWARPDGGEAGLHPSNIHDNAYSIGAIDFTGDMPIILGPDGPSLGGFVCLAVVAHTELWKIGQLRPGDRVRFHRVSQAWAAMVDDAAERALATLRTPSAWRLSRAESRPSQAGPILHRMPATLPMPEVVYRQSGDRYLLVEYGPPVLDLNLRFRVHALMLRMQREKLDGIVDLTPGIRSLQIHFDRRVGISTLLDLLIEAEAALPAVDQMQVATRIVHMPLSWDDPAARLAIEKYTTTVRKDAPWCPSNIEFIRRINGLDSIEQVREIVFGASYLVLGLGDVYLGAPVATPVDPRHRLVTTKYNPARTWTPENAVGIGGAYLCIYGMEGPGGYQLVGRTLQVWNRWRETPDFVDGRPWLLRFFDQIRFFPVGEDELLEMRAAFELGRYKLKIEETNFSLAQYNAFLRDNAPSIAAFKTRQQTAYEAEHERWHAAGQTEYAHDEGAAESRIDAERDVPPNGNAVATQVAGSVWKVQVKEGETVAAGATLVIVESMKMEIAIAAPHDGKVVKVLCREGASVAAGQNLLVMEPQI